MDTRRISLLGLFVLVFIEQTHSSFWNEIPQRCTYDRRTIFTCWNTTFLHPIPLLHDLETNTFQNHQIHIRNSLFQISLRDLLVNVGTNIENLTLINNVFAQSVLENNFLFEGGIFFRLLLTLQIHDVQGFQWLQLNGSYFPQLINLDLSNNEFSSEQKLVFDHQYYPKMQTLNLSHNQLTTIDHLLGNALDTIETLILAYNPLESIGNDLQRFRSLRILDLSSTTVKHLFSITLTPNLHTFICQQCRQIPTWEFERFLSNCSTLTGEQLTIDLTNSNIYSIKFLNPHIRCIKNVIFNDQNLVEPITTNDLRHSINLQSIELRRNSNIDYVYLNVYDHLISIDFSENIYLYQVILRLMSNYTHLQRLVLSHTALNDFSVDFYNSSLQFLHIDLIDMSHSRLETLDFLQYVTFHTLDVSYNRLKIIDLSTIHYRNGMYDLLQMNLLNLSANEMEYLKISWENESPRTIDLSTNRLESFQLSARSTYTVLLGNNPKLSLSETTFHLDVPTLTYLDLTSIDLHALEYLIYLHNLTNIRTLILNENQLAREHRVLNWQLFDPWRKYLTHLSLSNMSLEQLDAGAQLDEFDHLLTIDFSENRNLQCNCKLQPFIRWLQTSPPILPDVYEPLQKLLRINCLISLFELHCRDDREEKSLRFDSLTHSSFFRTLFTLIVFILILTTIYKIVDRQMKRFRTRFYQRVYTDGDFISLHERHVTHKTDDE